MLRFILWEGNRIKNRFMSSWTILKAVLVTVQFCHSFCHLIWQIKNFSHPVAEKRFFLVNMNPSDYVKKELNQVIVGIFCILDFVARLHRICD